eukprot:NODE_8_length_66115_cov_0.981823.p30 type:complete len:239 gc:universal NODE_8_length_66115_cov_0.981823:41833-42549(+)
MKFFKSKKPKTTTESIQTQTEDKKLSNCCVQTDSYILEPNLFFEENERGKRVSFSDSKNYLSSDSLPSKIDQNPNIPAMQKKLTRSTLALEPLSETSESLNDEDETVDSFNKITNVFDQCEQLFIKAIADEDDKPLISDPRMLSPVSSFKSTPYPNLSRSKSARLPKSNLISQIDVKKKQGQLNRVNSLRIPSTSHKHNSINRSNSLLVAKKRDSANSLLTPEKNDYIRNWALKSTYD